MTANVKLLLAAVFLIGCGITTSRRIMLDQDQVPTESGSTVVVENVSRIVNKVTNKQTDKQTISQL